MKKSKKFWLLLISFLSIGTAIVWACAGGDEDGTELSMFTPEIINKSKYEPFFRTPYTRLYGYSHSDNSHVVFNDVNVTEWSSYFEGKASEEKLKFWLYSSTLQNIDELLLSIKGKGTLQNDSIKKYNFNGIPPEKINPFLFYLGFAKRNEAFTLKDMYSWYGEEKEKKNETVDIKKQIEGGLKLTANAKDDFIKERYIFQLVRLYYFNNQFEDAIAFYKKNESLFKTGNSMKWRALGYTAGAYYKQEKYGEANYIYSLIYDNFDIQKESAYGSFHPQEDQDWNTCLALAKNNREKTVLWHLFGLYFDEARAIKQIYALDPASDLLEVLLVRAVNIEEEKLNENLFLNYETDFLFSHRQGCDESLLKIVNQIANENKTINPAVWHIAAAYLNYTSKNYSAGDQFLKEAEKEKNTDDLYRAQYHVVSLFGKLIREETLNEAVEKKILPDVKLLFSGKTESLERFRYSFAQPWVRNTLAVLYAKKNEFEKAEMIQPGTITGRFNLEDNIKSMIAYFDNKNHSELETFFISKAEFNKNDYLNLLGIRFAQAGHLDSALVAFRKIPERDYLPGNPFNIRVKDCHDCDHEAVQTTKYTNLSFIEKMVEMKNKAETSKKEAAQNYFLLANGFYNMSYFGNSRTFYQNPIYWFDYYFDYSFYDDKKNAPEMDNKLALKYYLLAKENSKDEEFKAKCTFMAAKCEQNEWFLSDHEGYTGDFKAGTYFNILKNEYSNTKYYSEIISECGYFETFVNK